MKNILLIFLLPFIALAQKQIGSHINGKEAWDRLGNCMAFSADGNVLAISSPGEDFKIKIYKNSNNEWIQIGNNIVNKGMRESSDGSSINISLSSDGSTVAFVASFASYDKLGNSLGFSKLKIFRNISDNWTQLGEDIKEKEDGSSNRYSVSLSSDGNIVAVGSPFIKIKEITHAGSVRVFKNIDNNWKQLGKDITGGNIKYGYFGYSISLSSDGSTIAIGEPLPFNFSLGYGRVKILKNINNQWNQIGEDIKGLEKGSILGCNISLSSDGNTLAVTSYNRLKDRNSFNFVKVFKNVLNKWSQIGKDINASSIDSSLDNIVSLSGDGNIVAISYPPSDLKDSKGIGFARIFKNRSDSWVQLGKDIKNDKKDDFSFEVGFADSISLSSDGKKVAIGFPSKRLEKIKPNCGQVVVYDLSDIK
ncbi:WD40 repeat domain-containing protein [Flavobacterium sp.]|uniref:WD40 repeat domain-containing protein n=1 Tax=Flavobacterium sp. TaxID=239 RepID=UPI003752FF79